jgi:hypothetical protein
MALHQRCRAIAALSEGRKILPPAAKQYCSAEGEKRKGRGFRHCSDCTEHQLLIAGRQTRVAERAGQRRQWSAVGLIRGEEQVEVIEIN